MTITEEQVVHFQKRLLEDEAAKSTIQRYISIIKAFTKQLGDHPLTKERLIEWRDSIVGAAATVNVSVAAVNKFMSFLNRKDLHIRQLKVQRMIFRKPEKELSKEEYKKLVHTAERRGQERLARAIETICVLGIRVSELQYVTVESLKKREVAIRNKGKLRVVFITADLARKLKCYCAKNNIKSGVIIRTRNGKALSRTQLWMEMKSLCEIAGVEKTKVFPHNLRHLFAVVHYSLHKDIVRLADLLGHSNINTTRIYIMTSGKEHERELYGMKLLI